MNAGNLNDILKISRPPVLNYTMFKKIIFQLFIVVLCIAACKEKNNTGENKSTPVAATEDKTVSPQPKKNILFFGNSLTAGYGLDPSEAFPSLIQHYIDSLQLAYKVINGGLSGETTAGGKSRIDWLLEQPVDVFILELGGNDGLRGIAVAESTKNLQAIIDKVKAKYPAVKIVLAGMQVPPNMGTKYANDFKAMYPALATKNNIQLIPFLLEGVGGISSLNQPDGIHPTPEGHKIVAANVWKVLKGIL